MLHFFKTAAASVLAAAAGKVRLFIDTDGLPKIKDEANAVRVLGNGIASITLVSTVGRVKTYRLTRDDGSTFDFQVQDGADGLNGQGMPANAAPPAVAAASSAGTSTNEYALEDHTHAGVTSFNGRQGAVTPQQSDYDAFFTTPAEAAAAAPVQSFNGRAGSITPQQADYDEFFTTPAEAAAAAPVQSVAGKQGAVTLNSADVGLGNVKNPAAASVHSTAPQTLNQTLTALASMTIPANALQAGDAFEIDVLFATLVNTTAASNLEVAVFINGTQNTIITGALGTTAVAAPGRGGRAMLKLVFRSVGAAGSAICNGTLHVNALTNFSSNNAAVQAVNTTAAVTVDVRARTSAATTTGTVQFAAIEQAT